MQSRDFSSKKQDCSAPNDKLNTYMMTTHPPSIYEDITYVEAS